MKLEREWSFSCNTCSNILVFDKEKDKIFITLRVIIHQQFCSFQKSFHLTNTGLEKMKIFIVIRLNSFAFQARHKGHDYVFSLLTGYRDPPAGVSVISAPRLLAFD